MYVVLVTEAESMSKENVYPAELIGYIYMHL